MSTRPSTDPAPEWRDVPGFDGQYQASTAGQVRSKTKQGGWRILQRQPDQYGYRPLTLCRNGQEVRTTHHLVVALTFIGPRPEGMQTRHLDGDSLNNRLENLAYGTRSENQRDALKHGTQHNASLSVCIWGHAFDEQNTYWRPRGGRTCKACKNAQARRTRAEAAALRLQVEA